MLLLFVVQVGQAMRLGIIGIFCGIPHSEIKLYYAFIVEKNLANVA
jgi:hypothetical protein